MSPDILKPTKENLDSALKNPLFGKVIRGDYKPYEITTNGYIKTENGGKVELPLYLQMKLLLDKTLRYVEYTACLYGSNIENWNTSVSASIEESLRESYRNTRIAVKPSRMMKPLVYSENPDNSDSAEYANATYIITVD